MKSREFVFELSCIATLVVMQALGPGLCAAVETGVETASDSQTGEESVPRMFGSDHPVAGAGKRDEGEKERFLDVLWNLPVIYQNPDNPWLQEFRLVGRYHGQYGNVSASQGDWDGWENRRVQFGIFTKFLGDFSARITYEHMEDDKGVGDRMLQDGWVSWRPSDKFGLKLGQQKPLWSNEWSTSSRFMLTFERSLLVNQLHPGFSIGAYASGKLGKWGYGLGVFSGDTNTGFGGGQGNFTLVNIGHDFKPLLRHFDRVHWRFDWIWNNDSEQLANIGFKHAFSSSITAKQGRVSLMTNVFGSRGEGGQGSTFGVVVMPAYELIPNTLQLVVRYQFARGNDDGLVLQKRYEREVMPPPGTRGERYHALYGGLNYFIHGDRLKLMAGLEYSNMNDKNGDGGDFSGWTFFAGVRMYF